MTHCSLFLPPLCPTPMSHFLPGICWDALSQVAYPTSSSVKWGPLHKPDRSRHWPDQSPKKIWDAPEKLTSALIVPAVRLH